MRNDNTMLHMKLNSAVSVFSIAAAFSVFLPPSFTSSALAAQPLLQIPPEQRGLLSIELPTDASAARLVGICFLPDCQDDNVMFGDVNMDINEDTEYCEKEGYTYYASGKCPQYQDAVGTCSRDDLYLKCDAEAWCKNNGYNTTSCSIPQYVDEQCPNGKPYYKQCKTDNDRACQELGYTKTCPSGQKLYQNSGRCSYDSSYGTCCTPSGCPSYTSTSYSSYGTNGTDGCEYACYYTCDMDCPSSYPYSSDPTGCSSSSKNGCGNKTCYNSVSCCNSSSSDWCSVHDTCHGDCCSDGTIQSCDSRCGGSGCSSSGSDNNSNNNSGSDNNSGSETCTYTLTASDCSAECKNKGSSSCARNGIIYYASCGSSKCTSGQYCSNGSCVSQIQRCCGYFNGCGYNGGTSSPADSDCQSYYGMSCYNGCKSLGYPDCNDVQDNCRASGGTVSEFGCEYTKKAGIVLLACYFGYH